MVEKAVIKINQTYRENEVGQSPAVLYHPKTGRLSAA